MQFVSSIYGLLMLCPLIRAYGRTFAQGTLHFVRFGRFGFSFFISRKRKQLTPAQQQRALSRAANLDRLSTNWRSRGDRYYDDLDVFNAAWEARVTASGGFDTSTRSPITS